MKKEFITIKIARNTYRKILLDEIIYCKADRSYSIIKTNEAEITYSYPLKELEKLITNSLFVRVNRSCILNITKCLELKIGKAPTVTLITNEQIAINSDCIHKIAEYLKIQLSEVENR